MSHCVKITVGISKSCKYHVFFQTKAPVPKNLVTKDIKWKTNIIIVFNADKNPVRGADFNEKFRITSYIIIYTLDPSTYQISSLQFFPFSRFLLTVRQKYTHRETYGHRIKKNYLGPKDLKSYFCRWKLIIENFDRQRTLLSLILESKNTTVLSIIWTFLITFFSTGIKVFTIQFPNYQLEQNKFSLLPQCARTYAILKQTNRDYLLWYN